MSDTPRTDDELWKVEYTSGICEVVYADFARTLELNNTALQARVKELEKDKARLDWLESQRVQLNCTMGAPGNYHYQVGCWPSQHSYRAAIDERMESQCP